MSTQTKQLDNKTIATIEMAQYLVGCLEGNINLKLSNAEKKVAGAIKRVFGNTEDTSKLPQTRVRKIYNILRKHGCIIAHKTFGGDSLLLPGEYHQSSEHWDANSMINKNVEVAAPNLKVDGVCIGFLKSDDRKVVVKVDNSFVFVKGDYVFVD